MSLSQQLLRGAGRRANTAALRIASYNQQATEAETNLAVIGQLADVDRAYWRLFQTRRELEVAQQQWELAKNQQDRAEHRVNAGSAAQIEVTRAQAGVADRMEAIMRPRPEATCCCSSASSSGSSNMPGLDGGHQGDGGHGDAPDPVQYVFESEKVADLAVANRMEMLDLELRLAADAASIGFARNQMLPLLTLDYRYQYNGLGGSRRGIATASFSKGKFNDWS